MKKYFLFILSIVSLTMFYSCSKDDNESGFKAVFSSSTDGFKVNFTNFSREAKEFEWDFGDGLGIKSSLKSPQYVYKAKGQYLVTLTAKNGSMESVFIDTVVIVGPNIKIDNDFSDWDYIDYTVKNEDPNNSIIGIKTFANSTDLFFMIEGAENMALSPIVLYMDTDKNNQTGYNAWQFGAGSGADFKLEGSFAEGWGGLAKHSGNMADGWAGFVEIETFLNAITKSSIRNFDQNKKRVEFSVKRSLLGNISGSIKFGIVETGLGSIPTIGSSTSFVTFPL